MVENDLFIELYSSTPDRRKLTQQNDAYDFKTTLNTGQKPEALNAIYHRVASEQTRHDALDKSV
eukprot:scaffold1091_cov164-Ochromonas_danica.AAC.65